MPEIKLLLQSEGATVGNPTNFDGTAVAKSASYTVLDDDNYRTFLYTTGSSSLTLTLPTAVDNAGRIITIVKVDSGSGNVVIDGEGSEAVNGASTLTLTNQYCAMTIMCDGSNWYTLDRYPTFQDWTTFTPTLAKNGGGGTLDSSVTTVAQYLLIQKMCFLWVSINTITISGAAIGLSFTLPFASANAMTLSTTVVNAGTEAIGRVTLTASSTTIAIGSAITGGQFNTGSTSAIYMNFMYKTT